MCFFSLRLWAVAVLMSLLACGPDQSHDQNIITIWAHDGQPAEKQALERIIENFNHTANGVRAVLQFKQEQGYGNRVHVAAISHMLPDILDVDAPYTAQFAENGILTPLEALLPDTLLEDFYPASLEQGKYRGQLYTLGAFESTIVLYYNKNYLARCGLEAASSVEQAWDWQYFLESLRALQKEFPAVLPLETFMPWGGEWLTYAFLPVVWSNQGTIISARETGAGAFNSPEVLEALQAWQQLFDEEHR